MEPLDPVCYPRATSCRLRTHGEPSSRSPTRPARRCAWREREGGAVSYPCLRGRSSSASPRGNGAPCRPGFREARRRRDGLPVRVGIARGASEVGAGGVRLQAFYVTPGVPRGVRFQRKPHGGNQVGAAGTMMRTCSCVRHRGQAAGCPPFLGSREALEVSSPPPAPFATWACLSYDAGDV